MKFDGTEVAEDETSSFTFAPSAGYFVINDLAVGLGLNYAHSKNDDVKSDTFVVMPLFLFICQCIVLAEENFLRGKFGQEFDDYCKRVNRWIPDFRGISTTFASMEFKWKRWLIKEYNTQFVWLSGIALILLFIYPQLTHDDSNLRNYLAIGLILLFAVYYFSIRYLKKSGKWTGD